jgi:adenylate cyclase
LVIYHQMNMPASRIVYVALVSLLITGTLSLRYIDPLFVSALRLIAFDSYQSFDHEQYDKSLPIKIIDVDEQSLSKVGQWPWPRTTLRDLLLRLASNGAAVIAFDFLFAEPDRTSLEEIVKQLPPSDSTLIRAAATDRLTNDQAFAAALRQTPSVLAISLGQRSMSNFHAKAGFAIAGQDPRPFIVAFKGGTKNLPLLDDAARGLGAFNWTPDRDQIVRRVALIYRVGEIIVPTLAVETLRVAQGANTYLLKSANASGESAFGQSTGLNHIRIGQVAVPTDSSGALYIKFRHFNRAAYIPAWKVLTGAISKDQIEGRIILVGTSAPGLLDLRATPLDSAIPGIDIHAQVIEQLLTGRFLTRPDYALALEEFVILVFGICLAFLLPRVSAKIAIVVGLSTILLVLVVGWIAYRYMSLLLDPSYPAVALACVTAALSSYVYHGVEAQRAQIRHAFGRYLAPAVVQEIISDPDKLRLGGEERELTLMFCDVRNFTAISQSLSAIDLTQFINELLSPLSEIILEQRGTIDKYMGDAIMAFWNAPLDDPHHAKHACGAALQMIAKMGELNELWGHRARAYPHSFNRVEIGIGINTGQCCVGNLGSTYRFDYSAIGDEVNVTSRLEALTKLYGVPTILSSRALAPGYPALELDRVFVKGRTRPTQIFTLTDCLGAMESQRKYLEQTHDAFLMAYRGQQWDRAQQLIVECRKIGLPQLNTYYSIFASRIQAIRQTSLPPDWDGAFAMTEK